MHPHMDTALIRMSHQDHARAEQYAQRRRECRDARERTPRRPRQIRRLAVAAISVAFTRAA